MKKKTILLVEDDAVVRDMIRGALEGSYSILEASNCLEVHEFLSHHLDLAIVDYMLPDGTGFDILEVLRQEHRNLPVIFMTAYSSENLAIRALREGITDYVKKPLSFAYLRGKLSEILEGKKTTGHPDSSESREIFIMDSIAAFIHDNFGEDLSRGNLAGRAYMSESKFGRAFKERFGRSVQSYLQDIRLSKAANLLGNNQDLSITDIALFVGYANVAHFTRMFKKVYGISPLEYRRKKSGS